MRYVPQRGDTYVHEHFLDTDWVPGPGQKFADAPKARMKVIHVTPTRVTSSFAESGMGRFTLERETFCRHYGEQALASRT